MCRSFEANLETVEEKMKRTLFPWLLILALAACGGTGDQVSVVAPSFDEFPKIDVHAHYFLELPGFDQALREHNLRVVNICVGGGYSPDTLEMMQSMAEAHQRRSPDIFAFASTFDLTGRDAPGYHDSVAAWLDRGYEAGAVMTKAWKEIGMEFKRPDGSYMLPDDPILDPVYSHIARRGKPFICHYAEPVQAWLPLDSTNAHYGYYKNNPEWHLYGKPGYPSYEDIIASRDRVLEKHPELTVIGAHNGSMSHDVDMIAQRLDRYPNFHIEVSARTVDLSRQPTRKVRDFFIRYQDRIMYGMDTGLYREPDNPSAWIENLLERYRLDFQFYAGSGKITYRGREVECLYLPREVLEKFYYRNALRIIPGLFQ